MNVSLENYIMELTERIKSEKEYLKVLTGSTVLVKIKEECETKIKVLKSDLRYAVNKLRRYDKLDFYEANRHKLDVLPEPEQMFSSKNYPHVDDETLPFDYVPEKKKSA